MIQFDFKNIVVLIALGINLVILWIIFRYGRNKASGRAYSIAVLSIVGWILPIVFYRAHFFDTVVIWSRVLYIMASLTSTSFFLFTLTFPEDKSVSLKIEIPVIIENLLIMLLCLHPTWLIRGVEVSIGREDIILWGPLYIVFALHISLFFLAGFIILYRKSRKAGEQEVKKQILSILAGYFFGANIAMVTNLLLPWFGYFELNWVGQVSSSILGIFTTYAIFKHRLLNIRIVAIEGFILILNFFLFIQLIFSESSQKFIINGVVSVAIIGVSYLLIKSFNLEIKRREEISALASNLEQANIKLQELDRQKTDFLSIAAHQLRTPLSIINGYVELIEDGGYGKVTKQTKNILHNIDESNGHLVKLVDEFLDITRIEQGRTKYDFKQVDIRFIIDSAVHELKDRAEQKGLKIVWDPTGCDAKLVKIDEEKVRHVVFNFIDNAIKYSDKGKILVKAQYESSGLAVRVTDSGFGFEKIDEANFFQKFYRGENVKGTNVNGTGLGLYVCKKFIDGHQGKIWAHSDGLGKGSEFGFWVPFS